MVGSAMTSFAIGIWLFTETGSVTAFALSNFFVLAPFALASLVAGTIVDRFDRRNVMIAADTIQAVGTLTLGILFFTQSVQLWLVYLIISVGSVAQAFQRPAWEASIVLLVPPDQLGRAAGMGRLSQAIARLAAPGLAGGLVLLIGLPGIIMVDLVTFFLAILILLGQRIPSPTALETASEQISIWQDTLFGWRYLLQRRGLLAFVIMNALLYLYVNFAGSLTVPLALILTNEAVVGVMMSVISSGMLLGALVMSVWGGPTRRMPFILTFIVLEGIAIFTTGLQPSIPLITGARFIGMICFAISSALIGALMQSKVNIEIQGRVFAATAFISTIAEAVGHATVGPVVDRFFEPLMTNGGVLAQVLGPLIGVGPGRGMGVVFLLMGFLMVATGLYGYLNPRIRYLEDDLPDVTIDRSRLGFQA